MKRNTLMKRMAIAALVATMSVGMAVPAMADVQVFSTSQSDPSTGKTSTATFNAAVPDSQNESRYTAIQQNTFNRDYEIKLDAFDVDNDAHAKGVVNRRNKTNTGTAAIADNTVTDDAKPNMQYTVEYVGTDRNADVSLDNNDAKVVVTPEKFGTTRFKITEKMTFWMPSWWDATAIKSNLGNTNATINSKDQKIEPNGQAQWNTVFTTVANNQKKFSADSGRKSWTAEITYYVAFGTPVSATTLDEVVKDAAKYVDLTDSKVTAAENAKQAIVAEIKARDPKYTGFTYTGNTITGIDLNEMNKAYNDLEIAVTEPSDIKNNQFTANVTINDKDNRSSFFVNNKYTFTFDEDMHYTDVTTDDYYYDAVKAALRDGAFEADSDTEFGANDEVTRADFVYAMWKKAGAPQVSNDTLFKDLNGLTADQKTAISWAVNNHYAYGKSQVAFAPNEKLNRAAVVQFLWYQAGQPENYEGVDFSDVTDGAWYAKAVQWGKATGKVAGTTSTTFTPSRNVKKKEAASFLYR